MPRRARESAAQKRERVLQIVKRLEQLFPIAECPASCKCVPAAGRDNSFGACTDERVNKSTPELFRRFPDAAALSAASQEDVEEIVKPLGFFRSKATNLRAMAAGLVEHHGGEVPADLEALVVLAGVGRKTASVVLGTWFGIPSGVVVDTHVRRLTNLLGLVKSQNAEIIERELMELVPQSEWINFSHRLIHHGRRTCVARRPQCGGCGLLSLCQRVGLPALDEPEDAV